MIRLLKSMVGRELRRRSGHDNLAIEFEALRQSTQGAVANAEAATLASIVQHTAWAESAPLRWKPLVSIIMPTRNRAALVGEAIESAQWQSYTNWELLAVDDKSEDETAAVLAAAASSDNRIRVIAGAGNGAAAARNTALARANGEIITFLDDDNSMARHWLRAVVAHLGRHTDVDAVYGAQLRTAENQSDDELSLLFRVPFERSTLMLMNYIDLGSFAARAGTPELSFDESLQALIDWDMFIRVSEHATIQPLAVFASMYLTNAPARISSRPDVAAITESVKDRYSAKRRSK